MFVGFKSFYKSQYRGVATCSRLVAIDLTYVAYKASEFILRKWTLKQKKPSLRDGFASQHRHKCLRGFFVARSKLSILIHDE